MKCFMNLYLVTHLLKIANDLEKLKTKLKETSGSAQLWLLYLDYISIAKLFILAERTSN